MKASVVMKELQKVINQHGDLDVAIDVVELRDFVGVFAAALYKTKKDDKMFVILGSLSEKTATEFMMRDNVLLDPDSEQSQ